MPKTTEDDALTQTVWFRLRLEKLDELDAHAAAAGNKRASFLRRIIEDLLMGRDARELLRKAEKKSGNRS